MATIRDTFIQFSLVGLLVLSTLFFVVQVQIDNDLNQSILDNDVINNTFQSLQTNLSSISGQTETQTDSFNSEIPERGFGTLLIFSIVATVQFFSSLMIAIFNLLVVLPASVLGVPQVVTSILSSIFLVILVLLAFKTYRAGE